ncbi:hypothetical protein FF011L_48740 [Roseimaritima multifibrata]|uniref:Uncharacterized protein n=1 Tax=Roseimaritima multifibrata TaxID=1930274 RepID=A0A517MMI7_9BACT|nr:hypothetical protein FF011L_48740 [Roseimaritima multifibrata]
MTKLQIASTNYRSAAKAADSLRSTEKKTISINECEVTEQENVPSPPFKRRPKAISDRKKQRCMLLAQLPHKAFGTTAPITRTEISVQLYRTNAVTPANHGNATRIYDLMIKFM